MSLSVEQLQAQHAAEISSMQKIIEMLSEARVSNVSEEERRIHQYEIDGYQGRIAHLEQHQEHDSEVLRSLTLYGRAQEKGLKRYRATIKELTGKLASAEQCEKELLLCQKAKSRVIREKQVLEAQAAEDRSLIQELQDYSNRLERYHTNSRNAVRYVLESMGKRQEGLNKDVVEHGPRPQGNGDPNAQNDKAVRTSEWVEGVATESRVQEVGGLNNQGGEEEGEEKGEKEGEEKGEKEEEEKESTNTMEVAESAREDDEPENEVEGPGYGVEEPGN